LFCGVHSQSEGPKSVVVGSFGMVEEDLAGLPELVAFYVVKLMPVKLESSSLHVLDVVVADAGLVGVDGPDSSPVALDHLHVARASD